MKDVAEAVGVFFGMLAIFFVVSYASGMIVVGDNAEAVSEQVRQDNLRVLSHLYEGIRDEPRHP